MTDVGNRVFESSWGILPPHFAGRQQEIIDIRRMVGSGHTVPLLVGRRGVGKTCLIRKVLEGLIDDGWIVEPSVWASAPDRSMTPSQAATVIIDAARNFRRKASPPRASLQIGFHTYEDARADGEQELAFPNVPLAGLTAELEEMGTKRAGQYVAELLSMAVQPTATHRGLLVVVDEIHMQGVDAPESPIAMLAQVISHCRELKTPVRFILAGMPLAAVQLEKSLGGGIDLIHTIKVGHLSLDETREAITQPLSKIGKSFEAPLLDRIYADTDGHPKLVQFFAQAVLDSCREETTYCVAQYLEVAARIEQSYYNTHYHEVLSIPEKRLEALWAMARATEWRSVQEHRSPEQTCISPQDMRQFTDIEPSHLDRHLGQLMKPGGDYIYKADRALYGFLKPLLWKYLLRWRGEKALLDSFGRRNEIQIVPQNLDDPTKARVQLKRFIAEATRSSQQAWFIDEYFRADSVKDYLESINGLTDTYLVTRLEPPTRDFKHLRKALSELRAARKGRVYLCNFEGPSSIFPMKGRYIITGPDTGVESSQSFGAIGQRLSTISMLDSTQISLLIDRIQQYQGRFEEIEGAGR